MWQRLRYLAIAKAFLHLPELEVHEYWCSLGIVCKIVGHQGYKLLKMNFPLLIHTFHISHYETWVGFVGFYIDLKTSSCLRVSKPRNLHL